jgi:hypothetical protein
MDESLLRPDLVVWEDGADGEVCVIDVAVPFDNRRGALAAAREQKMRKYGALVDRMRVRSEFKVPHNLDALVVGALGSWVPGNDALLTRLGVPKGRIPSVRRQMISAAIKWSRDIYVEHMTGARQYDAGAVAGGRRDEADGIGADGVVDGVDQGDADDGAPIIGCGERRREQ